MLSTAGFKFSASIFIPTRNLRLFCVECEFFTHTACFNIQATNWLLHLAEFNRYFPAVGSINFLNNYNPLTT
jgi:hypothetical protein